MAEELRMKTRPSVRALGEAGSRKVPAREPCDPESMPPFAQRRDGFRIAPFAGPDAFGVRTAYRPSPTRVPVRFQGKDGQVALDQIRTVDKSSLAKRLRAASKEARIAIAGVLIEIFALNSET